MRLRYMKHYSMNKIIKIAFIIMGILTGNAIYMYIIRNSQMIINETLPQFILGIILVTVLAGYVSSWVFLGFVHMVKRSTEIIHEKISSTPKEKLLTGMAGLLVGLVLAYLLTGLLSIITIPYLQIILTIIVYLFMGYLGFALASRDERIMDLQRAIANLGQQKREQQKNNSDVSSVKMASVRVGMPKILDTSVIIDGRIADICRAGFIDGPLIIPEFVLVNLRRIANDEDELMQKRGRRGLEMMSVLQKELMVEVKIAEDDFSDVQEEEIKLIKLAQQLKGKLITSDVNLNKIAELHSVQVLNMNHLAEAVKPTVLTGDEMQVLIVKEGKSPGQGVGYMNDGTMIVVENGKQYMDETIDVVVTSALQTAAGRMIFAKPLS